MLDPLQSWEKLHVLEAAYGDTFKSLHRGSWLNGLCIEMFMESLKGRVHNIAIAISSDVATFFGNVKKEDIGYIRVGLEVKNLIK